MSTVVTRRISALASGGKTSRVAGNPTGSNVTSRFSFLLALEGDESGLLLLEGDMQDIGTDALRLEGDAGAATIGSTVTKRLAEPVT